MIEWLKKNCGAVFMGVLFGFSVKWDIGEYQFWVAVVLFGIGNSLVVYGNKVNK